MAHKRVTISLPPELNERWNDVVKKHGLVKSLMVQNYLNEVLPVLEKKEPHKLINLIVKEMNEEKKLPSLFE